MTVIPQSERRTEPAGAIRPSENMSGAAALASLLTRVRVARVLREHHVWEAVRILPQTTGLPERTRQSPAFRQLMEKDALAAALRLVAQCCRPARNFHTLEPQGDRWVATLSLDTGLARRQRRFVRTEHRDPAAAMLLALLESAGAGKARSVARRPRTAATSQGTAK